MVDRLALANLPTPLTAADRLTEAWGSPRIWIKRDDLTGFGLSGNKIRKLEYHLAAAREAGASALITAGAAQSNHCRATALAAAQLGFDCHLFLRTSDGLPVDEPTGNHLLHHLSGAVLHFVTPEQYAGRTEMMAAKAAELKGAGTPAWVIPEGASDYLGMLGFAEAGRELAGQLAGYDGPPAVWHASSSGGTTAGLAMAASQTNHAFVVVGTSVGDTVAELNDRLAAIWQETSRHRSLSKNIRSPILTDAYIGGGYGVVSDEELRCQLEVTRLTGLLFDPVYTGKAIYALREEIRSGRMDEYSDIVFWHTGGGFGVFAHDFSAVLA